MAGKARARILISSRCSTVGHGAGINAGLRIPDDQINPFGKDMVVDQNLPRSHDRIPSILLWPAVERLSFRNGDQPNCAQLHMPRQMGWDAVQCAGFNNDMGTTCGEVFPEQEAFSSNNHG
jgi:hypothetical protein